MAARTRSAKITAFEGSPLTHAICKRCHRIRVIKEAGYCATCRVALRALERPKPSVPAETSESEQPTVPEGLVESVDLCGLCIDPINKPHVDDDGTKRWRACPNPATRDVTDNSGRPMRICEQCFAKEAS